MGNRTSTKCHLQVHNNSAARRTWDNYGQKYKKNASGRHGCFQTPVHHSTNSVQSKYNCGHSKKTAQVIQHETPTNIHQTEKEQLTQIGTIFNSVATKFTATEADKKGTNSKQYAKQMMVDSASLKQPPKHMGSVETFQQQKQMEQSHTPPARKLTRSKSLTRILSLHQLQGTPDN